MPAKSIKGALEGKLTDEEMKGLVKSFDIIGDIAVIEIPEALQAKERLIGEALMEVHKSVKTVCKRAGETAGEYRVRPVKVIAGEKKTEARYTESGVNMLLDVSKVYFNPRLSHERERVAALVKPRETVAVFFAGVGPYALVIAKKQPKAKVYAIEVNPGAFKYLEDNIRINKAWSQVEAIKGDVSEIAPELLDGKCDRVVMPLPNTAHEFLDVAVHSLKGKGVIHFYQIVDKQDMYSGPISLLEEAAEKHDRKLTILDKKPVKPYSPSQVQVVIDALFEKL